MKTFDEVNGEGKKHITEQYGTVWEVKRYDEDYDVVNFENTWDDTMHSVIVPKGEFRTEDKITVMYQEQWVTAIAYKKEGVE